MNSRLSTNSLLSSLSGTGGQAAMTAASAIATAANTIKPSTHYRPQTQPQPPSRTYLPSNKQASFASSSSQLTRSAATAATAAATSPFLSVSDMPDLSHLNEDERKIIESVLARQKVEEEMDSKLIQPNPATFRRNSNRTQSETQSSMSTITRLEDRFGSSQQRQSQLPNQRQPQPLSQFVYSQRHSISDIAATAKQRYNEDDLETGVVCDLCKMTKLVVTNSPRMCALCKSACCIRCSLRISVGGGVGSGGSAMSHSTTPRQLMWICVECKRKHQQLMKSAEWPRQVLRSLTIARGATSNATAADTAASKKAYTSDYILNKTQQSSLLTNGQHSDANKNYQASTKRQLPNLNTLKQQSHDVGESDSIKTENSAQSVPDLGRNGEAGQHASGVSSDMPLADSTSGSNSGLYLKKKTSKLKQAIIKQASLNNPPSYYKNLAGERSLESNLIGADYDEQSLYEKSSQTKSFTSNHDLLTRKPENIGFSSPNSSSSQLNLGNRKAEKLRDPLIALKSRQSNHSISTTVAAELNEQELYNQEKKAASQSSSTAAIAAVLEQQRPLSSAIESPATMARRIHGRSILIEQRTSLKGENPNKKMLLMMHSSLSHSSGEEKSSTNRNREKAAAATTDDENLNLDEHSTPDSSSTHKTAAAAITAAAAASATTVAARSPRKQQPVIPSLSSTASSGGSVDPNSIKNKLLLKIAASKHQAVHSLTSSEDDDDMHFIKNKHYFKPNGESGRSGEIEDENFDMDRPEEIELEDEEEIDMRSVTECTTNDDDMELESASAANAHRLNSNQRMTMANAAQRSAAALGSSTSTAAAVAVTTAVEIDKKPTLIDDYLGGVQNMQKEEILAAKINKFLSPTNWQASNDGKKLIGYVVIKRNTTNMVNSTSTSTIDSSSGKLFSSSLGLKIVGGLKNPLTQPHQLSAYIVKVKSGSSADLVGRLQPADEVVKWNGLSLRGLTYDEVCSIIGKSKLDAQVELVVERVLDDVDREKLNSLIKEATSMIRHQDSVDSDHQLNSNNVNNRLSNALKAATGIENRQQQHRKLSTSVPTNAEIGKLELKVLHDSLENKLYVNLLAINLNKQIALTPNSIKRQQQQQQQQQQSLLNDVESIFCKLNLLTNKKIELFSKLGQTCHRSDDSVGLSNGSSINSSSSNEKWWRFDLNEAFTFESLSSSDLNEIYAEIEVFNNWNKQVLGKASLDLGSSMFENQLLNLNIYSAIGGGTGYGSSSTGGEQQQQHHHPSENGGVTGSVESDSLHVQQTSAEKEMTPRLSLSQQASSIDSNNSGSACGGSSGGGGSNANKRRQLPQIPLEKQKESRNKVANDLVEKARKLKLESSLKEGTTTTSGVKEDDTSPGSTDYESASLKQTKKLPQPQQPQQVPYETSGNGSQEKQEGLVRRRKMPLLKNERKSLSVESSATTTNYDAMIAGVQQTHQYNRAAAAVAAAAAAAAKRFTQMPSSEDDDEISNAFNCADVGFEQQQQFNENRRKLSVEPMKSNLDSSTEFLVSHRRSDAQVANKANILGGAAVVSATSSSRPELATSTFTGPHSQIHQQKQLSKSAYLSTSTQSINEESLYLNSGAAASAAAASSTGVAASAGPVRYTQRSNPTLNRVVTASNAGTNRPEKLFSAQHLNQIKNSSTRNINKIINGVTTAGDIDSDGSENSLLSNASKMSVQSGPPEFLKGSNQAMNANVPKKLSGLMTGSDPNRVTTVSTNANSTTTTITTVLNNASSSFSNLDQMMAFTSFQSSFPPVPPAATTNSTETVTSGGGGGQQATAASAINSMVASSNELGGPGAAGTGGKSKRRPSMAKALVILGLSKKSNSASNLTMGKRFGFARSEEFGFMPPELRNRNLSPPSGNADGATDDRTKPKYALWSGALKLPHEQPFSDFIDRLGPGQKVSRQVLGLPCLGEIKMTLFTDKQKLNIEVIEVKNLKQKGGYKILPNVYVKFYLFNRHICMEKQKTKTQRRTLNPIYQETLKFGSDYRHGIVQVVVWGDYGKLDRKVLMGIAQITLDDCGDLSSSTVVGWYTLYPISSIITDFSMLASVGAGDGSGSGTGSGVGSGIVDDLTGAESEYSLSSQKSVK